MSNFNAMLDAVKFGSGSTLEPCYNITVYSKDTPILSCTVSGYNDIVVENCKQITNCFINKNNIARILNNRFSILNRLGIKRYLRSIGLETKVDILLMTHGVSLSDCLWVKIDGEDITWNKINPYKEKHLFDVNWLMDKGNPLLKTVIPNYSTNGNFPKCWVSNGNKHSLIKCGLSGAYNAGLEPLSEVLFPQIAEAIGFTNYVSYEPFFVDYSEVDYKYNQSGLLRETIGDNTKRLASKCNAFTNESTSLISAGDLGLRSFKECIEFAKCNTDNPMDLANILLCDCIGFNVDRHLGNIGFEYNPDTMEICRVAPMYDNNLSLLCYWEDRVNLEEYISSLCANDGTEFKDLARLVFNEYPVLRDNLISSNICLESDLVINDRLNILNDAIQNNIRNLLS